MKIYPCDNCGRKFRSLDRLHLHWILYSCTGKRETELVKKQKASPKGSTY